MAALASCQASTAFMAPIARADEGGASIWLPGQYASFAAVPDDPGFSLEALAYFRMATAPVSRTFTVGASVASGYQTTEQYLFVTPNYTFVDHVLGGQLNLGATFAFGSNDVTVSALLAGPSGGSLFGTRSDSAGGMGDLYPFASLKWTVGRHNFMAYAFASVPTGEYDPNRLAGLAAGHWAIDQGAGYTYLGPWGIEFSLTAGLTENFMNPSTQYQSGLDGHLDWGASLSLTDSFYIGVAGYWYNQVTPDSGPGATLGAFESRVAGVGPQAGFVFSIGQLNFDLTLRGYTEFDAENRPEGWNVWLTLSLSRSPHKGAF